MATRVTQERVSGTLQDFTAPYFVDDDGGADISASTAEAAAIAQFNTDFSLVVTHVDYQQLSKHSYRVVCKYKPGKPQKLTNPPQGSISARFAYQETGQHVEWSLATVAKYPADAPDFDGSINVKFDEPMYRLEGYDIPAPTVTDTLELVLPYGQFTEQYRKTIMDLRGHVNSSPIFGRPAGTVRFVSAQSQKRSDSDLIVNLGFEYKPNITDMYVNSSITIPNVDGHDYVWAFTLPEVVVGSGTTKPHIRPKLLYAYVERLFYRSNLLPLLNIPGV